MTNKNNKKEFEEQLQDVRSHHKGKIRYLKRKQQEKDADEALKRLRKLSDEMGEEL